MKNKITYNDLIKISEKLDKSKEKDWDNHVESLFVNYLISNVEGSYDENELSNVYIDKKQYNKDYNKFYRSIDESLEESIPDIELEEKIEINM